MKLSVRLEFKVQDCWAGVFWRSSREALDVWICIVPMLPIHLRLIKPPLLGQDGIRDPDYPCDLFLSAPDDACLPPAADCMTDGHYLCRVCCRRTPVNPQSEIRDPK